MKLPMGYFGDVVAVSLTDRIVVHSANQSFILVVRPVFVRNRGPQAITTTPGWGVIPPNPQLHWTGIEIKEVVSVSLEFDEDYPEDRFHTRELRITTDQEVSHTWEIFCNGPYVNDG